MIVSLSFSNYKTFYKKVNISFTASSSIKRFLCNTVEINGRRLLKTVGVYGPNNTGKTCLILALANLKAIMLKEPHEDLTNSFVKDDDVVHYNVEYIINKKHYQYKVDFDCAKNIYLKEELNLVKHAPSNSSVISYETIITRELSDKNESPVAVDPSYPIVAARQFPVGSPQYLAKVDYIEFAKSIVLLRLDQGVDIGKTMQLMKEDTKASKFISKFVENCDLHIKKFNLDNEAKYDVDISRLFNNVPQNQEYLKFVSNHRGFRVPSFVFDSMGTKKLIALAGYVYDAIKNGKLLLIDEIDSSLHHIMTRTIVALFNNYLNNKAQLFFTTHDLHLLDLVHLLRKDQIYLTDIEDEDSIVTHLLSFSSKDEDGIRGNEDIQEHYLKGRYGSVPSPDLFDLFDLLVNSQNTKDNNYVETSEKHSNNI